MRRCALGFPPNPDYTVALPFYTNAGMVGHLTRRVKDLEALWYLLRDGGYLPATAAIARLEGDLDRLAEHLRWHEEALPAYYDQARPMPTDLPSLLPCLHLRQSLYFQIAEFADTLSVLSQHAVARLGSLSACDAAMGSTHSIHRFSGTQAIHDAAEAVMHDYVTSAHVGGKDLRYDGLVLFAYLSKTASTVQGISFFPVSAETRYDYFALLAHEAGHIAQARRSIARFRTEELLDALTRVSCFHYLLADVAVVPTDKFICAKSALRRLAGELLSDVYATTVAGMAYPRTLLRYFLPLVNDTVNTSPIKAAAQQDDIHLAFLVSSLKARTALLTAVNLGYAVPEDPELEQMWQHIKRGERLSIETAVAALNNQVPAETLYEHAARLGGVQWDQSCGLRGLLGAVRLNVEQVAEAVAALAPEFASRFVGRGFYGPVPSCATRVAEEARRQRAQVEAAMDRARDAFCQNGIDFVDHVVGLWYNRNLDPEELLRPRHLVALLGQEHLRRNDEAHRMSRFAALMALANHESIVGRYDRVQS